MSDNKYVTFISNIEQTINSKLHADESQDVFDTELKEKIRNRIGTLICEKFQRIDISPFIFFNCYLRIIQMEYSLTKDLQEKFINTFEREWDHKIGTEEFKIDYFDDAVLGIAGNIRSADLISEKGMYKDLIQLISGFKDCTEKTLSETFTKVTTTLQNDWKKYDLVKKLKTKICTSVQECIHKFDNVDNNFLDEYSTFCTGATSWTGGDKVSELKKQNQLALYVDKELTVDDLNQVQTLLDGEEKTAQQLCGKINQLMKDTIEKSEKPENEVGKFEDVVKKCNLENMLKFYVQQRKLVIDSLDIKNKASCEKIVTEARELITSVEKKLKVDNFEDWMQNYIWPRVCGWIYNHIQTRPDDVDATWIREYTKECNSKEYDMIGSWVLIVADKIDSFEKLEKFQEILNSDINIVKEENKEKIKNTLLENSFKLCKTWSACKQFNTLRTNDVMPLPENIYNNYAATYAKAELESLIEKSQKENNEENFKEIYATIAEILKGISKINLDLAKQYWEVTCREIVQFVKKVFKEDTKEKAIEFLSKFKNECKKTHDFSTELSSNLFQQALVQKDLKNAVALIKQVELTDEQKQRIQGLILDKVDEIFKEEWEKLAS